MSYMVTINQPEAERSEKYGLGEMDKKGKRKGAYKKINNSFSWEEFL